MYDRHKYYINEWRYTFLQAQWMSQESNVLPSRWSFINLVHGNTHNTQRRGKSHSLLMVITKWWLNSQLIQRFPEEVLCNVFILQSLHSNDSIQIQITLCITHTGWWELALRLNKVYPCHDNNFRIRTKLWQNLEQYPPTTCREGEMKNTPGHIPWQVDKDYHLPAYNYVTL